MSVKNVNLLQLLAYPRMKTSVTIGFSLKDKNNFLSKLRAVRKKKIISVRISSEDDVQNCWRKESQEVRRRYRYRQTCKIMRFAAVLSV
jgi:hypothetical protein